MKRNYIFFSLFFLSLISCYGQTRIILEHKTKPQKKKILNLKREYTIKTVDTIYYSKIIDFTDSSLSVSVWVKSGHDTTYHYKQYGKSKDTNIVRPIYIKDTIPILFSDIIYLKKYWFKNRRWFEPFGWGALIGVLGIGALPIAAIEKGMVGVKEWVGIEAYLLGVSIPIIFIGTRQTKYDIKKKWNIKTTD